MSERGLRIVRPTYPITGICEHCSQIFLSREENPDLAEKHIRTQFDAHKCKPIENAQNGELKRNRDAR